MIALLLYRTVADHLVPWAMTLATRMLARSLNMPEPLVHATGLFVFERVQTFENSFLTTLCPKRLMRRLLALRRPAR